MWPAPATEVEVSYDRFTQTHTISFSDWDIRFSERSGAAISMGTFVEKGKPSSYVSLAITLLHPIGQTPPILDQTVDFLAGDQVVNVPSNGIFQANYRLILKKSFKSRLPRPYVHQELYQATKRRRRGSATVRLRNRSTGCNQRTFP